METGLKIKLFIAGGILATSYAITALNAGPDELPQESIFTYAGKTIKKTAKDVMFVVGGSYCWGTDQSLRQQRQQTKLKVLYQNMPASNANQTVHKKITELETKIKARYGTQALLALQEKCDITAKK